MVCTWWVYIVDWLVLRCGGRIMSWYYVYCEWELLWFMMCSNLSKCIGSALG